MTASGSVTLLAFSSSHHLVQGHYRHMPTTCGRTSPLSSETTGRAKRRGGCIGEDREQVLALEHVDIVELVWETWQLGQEEWRSVVVARTRSHWDMVWFRYSTLGGMLCNIGIHPVRLLCNICGGVHGIPAKTIIWAARNFWEYNMGHIWHMKAARNESLCWSRINSTMYLPALEQSHTHIPTAIIVYVKYTNRFWCHLDLLQVEHWQCAL